MTQVQKDLVRRFAETCVMAEAFAARLMNEQPVDVSKYSGLVGNLCKLADRIGVRHALT